MTDLNSVATEPFVGQPVRSLQHHLRTISREHSDIPSVVPDGIYGTQTRDSVAAFQYKFGLPVTGEADSETWRKINEEYEKSKEKQKEPEPIYIFPGNGQVFRPGDSSVLLIPIQAVLFVLALLFPHLGRVNINGNVDDNLVDVIKKLQRIYGMPDNGLIDKPFWDRTAMVYKAKTKQKFPGI